MPESIHSPVFRSYLTGIASRYAKIGEKHSSPETLTQYGEIIQLSTEALKLPDLSMGQIDILLRYRAEASFKRYHFNKKSNLPDLESAIRDFSSISAPHSNPRDHAQALMTKAYLLKRSSPKDAAQLLTQALVIIYPIKASIRSALKAEINLNLSECLLRTACEAGDVKAILQYSEEILSCDKRAIPFAMSLATAARQLVRGPMSPTSLSVVLRSIDLLDRALGGAALTSDQIAKMSMRAATLLVALGKNHAAEALKNFIRLAETGRFKYEGLTYSSIGRLSLEVGKSHVRAGNELGAANYFQDAINWLTKCIAADAASDGGLMDTAMTHSLLGAVVVKLVVA